MYKHKKIKIMEESNKVKLAIIYYSSTGANYQLARWAETGAKETGAEVRVRKVKELAPQSAIDSKPAWKNHLEETKNVKEATLDDLKWADAIIFSAPTRYGNMPSQMQQFFDTTGPLWAEGKLANKVVSAMSSAMNPHGGQETTILTIYKSMHHWGAIVVSPGYSGKEVFKAGGNPYGTSVTVDGEGNIKEDNKGAVIHQAKRTVSVAEALKYAEVEQG